MAHARCSATATRPSVPHSDCAIASGPCLVRAIGVPSALYASLALHCLCHTVELALSRCHCYQCALNCFALCSTLPRTAVDLSALSVRDGVQALVTLLVVRLLLLVVVISAVPWLTLTRCPCYIVSTASLRGESGQSLGLVVWDCGTLCWALPRCACCVLSCRGVSLWIGLSV